MPKDPICGMEGTLKYEKNYFCSDNCIIKFKKNQKGKPWPWYLDKFWIILLSSIIILIASYYFEPLNPVWTAFIEFFALIWWAILLGLLIGGIIDYYIPREYITKFLAGSKRSTIFNAAIFGFLMSACSHGILAIAIQLHKKGASIPAVITFLLASPWANIPITILLFGFFGVKALFLVVSALIIALITGFIYQKLEKYKLIEQSPKHEFKDFSFWTDVKSRFKTYSFNFKEDLNGLFTGMWALNKMVTYWILIGLILASFARAFVPTHFFHQYMGPTLLGLIVTLVIATIIEVCSEGSSPLAFEIYNQTGAFGNSFTFLMAGVATDYTEIGLIWSNIGRKSAMWLPLITVPQIVILGLLFNALL
tara:strand:+ start:1327 stop:2421 length:1095 start_codon:yes stop_codon:yes gene_type:complete